MGPIELIFVLLLLVFFFGVVVLVRFDRSMKITAAANNQSNDKATRGDRKPTDNLYAMLLCETIQFICGIFDVSMCLCVRGSMRGNKLGKMSMAKGNETISMVKIH